MLTIRFQDTDFVLCGDLESGGAIATQDNYENGRCSYAHLFENGAIKRFNRVIGFVDDIKVTGDCDPNVGIHSVVGVFTDPSWPVYEANCDGSDRRKERP